MIKTFKDNLKLSQAYGKTLDFQQVFNHWSQELVNIWIKTRLITLESNSHILRLSKANQLLVLEILFTMLQEETLDSTKMKHWNWLKLSPYSQVKVSQTNNNLLICNWYRMQLFKIKTNQTSLKVTLQEREAYQEEDKTPNKVITLTCPKSPPTQKCQEIRIVLTWAERDT